MGQSSRKSVELDLTESQEYNRIMSHIEIVEPKLEDAEKILNVQRTTWLATYPNKEAGIEYKDIEESVSRWKGERIKDRLASLAPEQHYWIAKDGEKVVGMCWVFKEQDKNNIQAIYVLPEYQGKHVGSALLKAALSWLGDEKDITLGVVTYNTKAIEFYKRFGFEEHGERHDSVATLPCGKVMPEIEMIRRKS